MCTVPACSVSATYTRCGRPAALLGPAVSLVVQLADQLPCAGQLDGLQPVRGSRLALRLRPNRTRTHRRHRRGPEPRSVRESEQLAQSLVRDCPIGHIKWHHRTSPYVVELILRSLLRSHTLSKGARLRGAPPSYQPRERLRQPGGLKPLGHALRKPADVAFTECPGQDPERRAPRRCPTPLPYLSAIGATSSAIAASRPLPTGGSLRLPRPSVPVLDAVGAPSQRAPTLTWTATSSTTGAVSLDQTANGPGAPAYPPASTKAFAARVSPAAAAKQRLLDRGAAA